MSLNSDSSNIEKVLGKMGLGPSAGEKGSGESSLAASIFGPKHDPGKGHKDGKGPDGKKPEEQREAERLAKEGKEAREAKLALEITQLQEQQRVADARQNRAALIQTKLDDIRALAATLETGLTYLPIEFREPAPQAAQPGQPNIPQIEKLGKAPADIQKAAQSAREAVALEVLAKVDAWRAFNGTDILSSPETKGVAREDGLADMGRQLVEMNSLLVYNKSLNAAPQSTWLADINKIASQYRPTDSLQDQTTVQANIQRGQVLQLIIERKVATLQTVLNDPALASQIRDLKNDAELTKFLTNREEIVCRTPLPADLIARAKAPDAQVLTDRDKTIQAQARAEFPGNDTASNLGRQLSMMQSYLKDANFIQARANLASAQAGQFADWMTPLNKMTRQQQLIDLKEKIEVLKQVTKTPAGQDVPVEMVSTKFLNLMQQSVASASTGRSLTVPDLKNDAGKQAIADDATRKAVLYLCQNPGAIDHILQSRPNDPKSTVIQEQISTVARALAMQMPAIANAPPALQQDIEARVNAKVKEITFVPKAPPVLIPATPAPGSSTDIRITPIIPVAAVEPATQSAKTTLISSTPDTSVHALKAEPSVAATTQVEVVSTNRSASSVAPTPQVEVISTSRPASLVAPTPQVEVVSTNRPAPSPETTAKVEVVIDRAEPLVVTTAPSVNFDRAEAVAAITQQVEIVNINRAASPVAQAPADQAPVVATTKTTIEPARSPVISDSLPVTETVSTSSGELAATQIRVEPGSDVVLSTHGNLQAQSPTALAPTVAAAEQGTPVSVPQETPQFSMETLNALVANVSHLGEHFIATSSFVPYVQGAHDLVKQTVLLNSIATTSIGYPSYLQRTESTPLVEAAVIRNDFLANQSVINLPTGFESQPPTETVLTGKGVTLDGSNRGPNAAGPGPMVVRGNSSFSRSVAASTWSPTIASRNWTASTGGAVLASTGSGGISSGGSSSILGANSSSKGKGSSGGPAFFRAFRPAWHCGFLNPAKDLLARLDPANPQGSKKDDDSDDDQKENLNAFNPPTLMS